MGGANCVLLETTGETATVHSFSDERKPFSDVPIGTIATSWVVPEIGEVIVLVMHEALYFGDRLDHTLICPNQLRSYGIDVYDTPRQFDQTSVHAIVIPEEKLIIPLDLNGVVSYFATHKPSDNDLDNCRRVVLSSDVPWNPNDPMFEKQERVLEQRASVASEVLRNGDASPDSRIEDATDATDEARPWVPKPPELLSDSELADRLIQSVNIAGDDWNGDGLDGYNDSELYEMSDLDRFVFSLSADDKRHVITKERLARRWGIGLDVAHKTLKQTTQRGIRTFLHPTDRRVNTRKPHLVFPTMRGKRLYTDTMFAKMRSLRSNTCAQVWTDGLGYDLFYPLESKREAPSTVWRMVHDLQGIPEVIVSDGSGEQTGGKWNKEINLIRARHHVTEYASPWQNRAEREIGEIKRGIKRATSRSQSPKRLWDYCGQWVAAIRRKTAHNYPELDGMPPEELMHGRMVDISAYAQFDWYEYVWYIDKTENTADTNRKLGRWIGVAENRGSPMTYMVLPKSCRPIARSSVFPLTQDD